MIPKYKDIIDLVKKGATVEAQEKILELREAAIELQEENATLRERLGAAEKRLEVKERLEFSKGVYWLYEEDASGDATIKDGPYCQLCYDDVERLVRLQTHQIEDYDPNSGRPFKTGQSYFECLRYKSHYVDD